MKRSSNMVSVLDTLVDGKDDNYEGMMKQHRNHYAQFYNIYKELGRDNEDGIEYVGEDTEKATFKVKGVDYDEVVQVCANVPPYDPLKSTTIRVEKDGDSVAVNITIK